MVYYNINESPLCVTAAGVTYYFTSEANKKRFVNQLEENRKIFRDRFIGRYYVDFNFLQLFDIILYNKCERRGSRVKIGGHETCVNNLKLNGEIRI